MDIGTPVARAMRRVLVIHVHFVQSLTPFSEYKLRLGIAIMIEPGIDKTLLVCDMLVVFF